MRFTDKVLMVAIFTLLIVGTSQAQELYIYPAKGQSSQQQEKDKFECYTWAKNDTGFDPMEAPRTT